MKHMCTFKQPKHISALNDHVSGGRSFLRKHIKRKRVRCPVCGRKMWGWAYIQDCGVEYKIPPHKRKGWWKKRKKVSRDNANVYHG